MASTRKPIAREGLVFARRSVRSRIASPVTYQASASPCCSVWRKNTFGSAGEAKCMTPTRDSPNALSGHG
uniref:Uncharacterized protein n=1 Tax=Human herpesvirus 2 TaxID=10310 RepID=A0A481TBH1_HHV2|nr:hypothetical protein [Human alphaherpesvirus 2]QBH78542.1 hypothetical protein [Human alphaherpesvirus 2]QBH79946.1 hypothetical protein [Human alphaherpesvirus 2]QBH82854.1 hypothetical protein [Human alphaherpesvirus 2]QBH84565.1 hypothetical protein [Human alphaherpesvirus 2]